MSRRRNDPPDQAGIEDLTQPTTLAPAAAGTTPPAAAPPAKHDYRFQVTGSLFGRQAITILGIAGGPEEARKELHRLVDASIVGIEANLIRDAKTLKEVTSTAALFNDGTTLGLPAGATVVAELSEGKVAAWKVSVGTKVRGWRPGFSLLRVRTELEQLKITHKQMEKPKTPVVGGSAGKVLVGVS